MCCLLCRNYEDIQVQALEGYTKDQLLMLQNHQFGQLVVSTRGTTAYTLLQVS